MAFLLTLFWAAGFAIFVFGFQTLAYIPLTLVYEIWKYRLFRRFGDHHTPTVTIIVPAYNEERTIVASVESILASDYPSFDVIVIDDGSTDATESLLTPMAESGRIIFVKKENGGKASALNAGIAMAKGEVVLYTDADSFFQTDTIRKMARWFVDPGIHAVCGNDTPMNPENALQRLLSVTTHIGTGFVRRALSILNVMPIISGNCGAVRKAYLDRVGGFSEVWGEDLDLTFKLHRERARIVYDSDALVTCEVPRTMRSLWKQRVRWTRSYIKIASLHRDLMFRSRDFPFSWYLPLNWFTMIGIPVLQMVTLAILPYFLVEGIIGFHGIVEILAYIGYGMFAVIAIYSIVLDRAPHHLPYVLLYGWLIIPGTYFYNAVVAYALYSEFLGKAEFWEKIERRRLEGVPMFRRVLARLALEVGPPAVVVTLIAVLVVQHPARPAAEYAPVQAANRLSITVATHFDAWQHPDEAITSVLRREHPEIISTVAIGAGRWEWNFFAWKGHEATWSNDQRSSLTDLLAGGARAVASARRRVVSIIDFYAPNFIREHPDKAARDALGAPSTDQVCFMELVRGEYGRNMIAMAAYLARSYDIEGISLTELQYTRYCYDPACLASYISSTGARDWPRSFPGGQIDLTGHAVGIWRSQLMSSFLRELADSVHAYGKKLYIDVPVDFDNLNDEGLASGLHYPALVRFADGLVVWDYLNLDKRPPETSEQIARFFVEHYGARKTIISIGLWGKEVPVTPGELSDAAEYAIRGGAQQLWITPNHLLSAAHWDRLVRLLDSRSATPTPSLEMRTESIPYSPTVTRSRAVIAPKDPGNRKQH